jgi:hypothetical protein
MALKTWKTIYKNPQFRSNVQRGVQWQRNLQLCLLERAVEADDNKFEIISDYIDSQMEQDFHEKLKEQKLKEAKESKKKAKEQKQQKIEFIQQAIKIKMEPNTTLTEPVSNVDEDEIETITID